MKQLFAVLAVLSISLMAAKSTMREKLLGVWKIESMVVKGVAMEHQQMGMPYMEFNEEGGFMVKMSASKEKGRYVLKGNTLTLNFKIPPKPAQKMTITRLDEKEMDYTTITNADTMRVTCFRITQGLGGDSDKDKDKDKDKK